MCTATFIIVNYNGAQFIGSCIESIYKQEFKDSEIVVVDNGSHDGSVDLIKKKYSDVKLVELDQNKGFTGGNNAGLKIARGKYIALVNNDVVLDKFWLKHMVEGIETSPDIGFCSSKIIISGTDRIDSIGDKFTTAFTGTKVGEYEVETKFDKVMDMNGVCAAAALYKRSMIDHIGFFNEMFFLNHEDTDLNMRAWLAGYKCRFVPEAIAYHDVNRTIGEYSGLSVYYFSRNSLWAWLINTPSYFIVRNSIQRFIYELISAFYYCMIKMRTKYYIKGKIDALFKLKVVLNRRSHVQKLVAISNNEITQGMIPIVSYIRKRLKTNRDFQRLGEGALK